MRKSEQEERAVLAKGVEDPVDIADDVLGRLGPGDGFPAAGVAALVRADPLPPASTSSMPCTASTPRLPRSGAQRVK
jgi:hypothetical protein